jgi:trans-aconitate methyltransferase
MSCFTTGEGYSLVHLTGGYPWERVAAGTVVDVGGSYGDVAFALAREYPHLKLVVQELPEVVANAQRDESLDVRFMEHSFFEEQPVKGAEVYLFRWILHNWPDKYCVRILRGLVPALKKGAKVLVMDGVSPPPGVLPNDLERNLR